MRIGFVLLTLAILLASGCATDPTPEERLKDLSSKALDSTYQVEYELERPGTSVTRNQLTNTTLYSFNGSRMFEASTSYIGGAIITQIYERHGETSVVCREEKGLQNSNRSCEISNRSTDRYTNASRYAERADEMKVAYLGEKSFAGRGCGMFGMGVPQEHFNTSQGLETGANVKMCVDREKGYIAFIQINLTNPVRTSSGKFSEIIRLEAQDHSPLVESEKVDPGIEGKR